MRVKSMLKQLNNPQLSRALLFIGAIASIMWSVYFAVVTIFIPYQIEFREGAAQVMTAIFLRGGNPFTFDNQPLAMNNYGIGYSLVAIPFAAIFGNTLLVHRSVTFGFVLLSAWLGFSVVHKKTRDYSLALSCAAFIMIGLIGRGGIGAFPSSMGVFLFLLAVLIPFFRSFDLASLVMSAVVSLVAFYTKAYFVLGFGVVASYLFLFVSKRKSIFYGLIFLFIFSISAAIIRYFFPLYFINTLFGNISNTNMTSLHMFLQLRDLLFIFYPVLTVLTILLFLNFFEKKAQEHHFNRPQRGVNFSGLDAPFIGWQINYFLYLFFCSFLAFVFILGPHIGAYLNYAYQLLVPTFFILFFQTLAAREKMRFLFGLAVLFNLFSWGQNLLEPAMLRQKNSQEWAQVFEYIHSSKDILNSPAVTSEIVALGQTPMDSGQTSYFYAVDPFSVNPFVGISYDEFRKDGHKYTFRINRIIEKQQFDLIITTNEKSSFYNGEFTGKYSRVDEIVVDMPQTAQHWTLVIWEPLLK